METNNEIWKDIEGYEDLYQVSNYGRVRSLDRYITSKKNGNTRIFYGKIMKPQKAIRDGYICVMLSKDSNKKYAKVHRLVAQAFIRNPDNLPEVNHKDEDKLNNCVWNLEWCTRSYNENYGTKRERGWDTRGRRSVEAYNENNEIIATFPSITDAAKSFGVQRCTIWGICNGVGTAKTCKGLQWRYKEDTT